MIRNRGLVDTVNLDTSESDSDDTDDKEDIPVTGAGATNITMNKTEMNSDFDAKDESKPDKITTSKPDEDPKVDVDESKAVEDENVQSHNRL